MSVFITRRRYLALTAAAAGLTAASSAQNSAQPSSIPKRVLGRTGVEVPILGFGSGSSSHSANSQS